MKTFNDVFDVTVVVITYNHGKYIRQCLEGILQQDTKLRIEIIVHDDASTDETQDVITEFVEKFPSIFKVILQQENQWSKRIHPWIDTCFPLAKGRYIALCEGDDWWCDTHKLSDQIEALDSDQQLVLSHTAYQSYSQKTGVITPCIDGDRIQGDAIEPLLYKNSIATLTVVARTTALLAASKILASDVWKYKMTDYPLWLEISHRGHIHYLPRVTATYRILEESMSHSTDIHKQLSFFKSAYDVSLSYSNKFGKNISSLKSTLKYIKDLLHHFGPFVNIDQEWSEIKQSQSNFTFVFYSYWKYCLTIASIKRTIKKYRDKIA